MIHIYLWAPAILCSPVDAVLAGAMAAPTALEDEAKKLLETHGIGKLPPPAKAEHWDKFKSSPATSECTMEIENRFYCGYGHSELNWTRPVHAIFTDFKGDSMQIGKLVERISRRGEQYVFVGNAPPFNGGWHFTAVNDFEHADQNILDPEWSNIRIWTQVNYVATVTEAGEPALTPRENFNSAPERKHEGAIPLADGFKFTHLHFTGGLMAHTVVANLVGEGMPAALVLAKHLELGATFTTIGHGSDVLISVGTPEKSIIEGFTVAMFPKQDHLCKISGLVKSPDVVAQHRHSTGAVCVSASHWCTATVEPWFAAVGLPVPEADSATFFVEEKMCHLKTSETFLCWEFSKMENVIGAEFKVNSTDVPRIAVFCDDVADPVEIFVTLNKLMEAELPFVVASHSRSEGDMDVDAPATRVVHSETVFGNAMYPLRDCQCKITSIPADLVSPSFDPDAFFAVGGQCPYYMLQDAAIMSIIDKSKIAAAVCHGPELLIGTKWLKDGEAFGTFISYWGLWMSFRDRLARYKKEKPGEVMVDSTGRLITGNAPNSTPVFADTAITTIKALESA